MPLAVTSHAVEAAAQHGKEVIPLGADVLFYLGPIPVTNSMLVLWLIVTPLLIFFARAAAGKVTMVPRGVQNFFEFLVENLYQTLEGILGRHLARRTFWFFATVFIVILTCNWVGLLPVFGNITFASEIGGQEHRVPLLRAATADLNLPLAIATVYFFLWIYWSLTEIGLPGMIRHTFGIQGGVKAEDFGFPKWAGQIIMAFIGLVFIGVGLVDVISILFRQISLPLRLFGNIYAGENLLHEMSGFWGGWLVTIPFYCLEILVGLLQAIVFMLLTAVFTKLMCGHEEEEAH